jgi:RNA polymerase sigma-70 factor (ECF subfamily)
MAIDFDNHQRPGWLAPACEHNGQRNTTIADIDLKQRRRLPSEGSLIEHMRGLSAFAMALTHNSFEADDLVQETYVRAVEAMGRLREESNIRAWLFTILRNVRLSQLRQQRARPKLVEVDRDENNAAALQTAEDPHAILVRAAETKEVWKAIQQLPRDFRAVLVMREYRGLSYQEIATYLGLPPGTVMSRLARARSRLAVMLTDVRHSRTINEAY